MGLLLIPFLELTWNFPWQHGRMFHFLDAVLHECIEPLEPFRMSEY